MSHEPVLSTDLFADISAVLNNSHLQTEPFNLLKFLFLRGECQTVVDIYGACNGWVGIKEQSDQKISTKLLDKNEERLHKLLRLYVSLSSFDSEDDYWAGSSLVALRRNQEAVLILEQSLIRGYRGAAALLAEVCYANKDIEQSKEYLKLLEPFDALPLWDRALAYRENGKLLDYTGKFELAREAFKSSLEIAKQLDNGKILFGLCAQLFATSSEDLGQSEDALKFILEAKPLVMLNRKVHLFYLQVLAATHCKNFDEARSALAELQTFEPNNPHLTALISYIQGLFAYCEDRIENAVLHFKDVISAHKGSKNNVSFFAHLYLLKCSIRLNDTEEAIKYFDQASHEFVDMEFGRWVPPAHLKRAQAELYLHHGILDVVLCKATAVDRLESALEIFGEFELDRERSQAFLVLAAWYLSQQDHEKAERYVTWAHETRTQDLTAFETILEMFPSLESSIGSSLSRSIETKFRF